MRNQAAGHRLRLFLESRVDPSPGWVADLSQRVGVSRVTVSNWLAGTSEPEMGQGGTLRRLADAVGCSRWELVRALDGE